MSTTEEFKLTYFDLRGRGEPIRLLFALADVQYKDNRVKNEEWETFKPTTPWGQLPILQIGKFQIAQAVTIGRFLATKFGLCGSNEFENTKCDEIVDALQDVLQEWTKILYEKDEGKRNEIKTNLLEKVIPNYFGQLELIQERNGGNFLVGSSVTWADLWVANYMERFQDTLAKNILNPYPNMQKLKDAVFTIPNIKKYIDKR